MQSVIVFDSGVGGFSILKQIIISGLPHPIKYFADQEGFPYGHRSPKWIRTRLAKFAVWAKAQNPAAVVLACNTATVNGIDLMRTHLSCPIIGVEPVIKPLANYHHPLVLATTSSLNSQKSQTLLNNYNPQTLLVNPSGLVEAVESMDHRGMQNSLLSLKPLIESQAVDAVGLSCTHYPLALTELTALYPQLAVYDPSVAVAAQLAKVLPFAKQAKSRASALQFYTTGEVLKLSHQVEHYLKLKVSPKQIQL